MLQALFVRYRLMAVRSAVGSLCLVILVGSPPQDSGRALRRKMKPASGGPKAGNSQGRRMVEDAQATLTGPPKWGRQ